MSALAYFVFSLPLILTVNIDNQHVELIKEIIDKEENHVLETKSYFKCLLMFNNKSAKLFLSHFLDRVNEARVISNLEDTKRAFQDKKSVVKRTRCVIGILWQPQQEDVDLLEAVLIERTTKMFVILAKDVEPISLSTEVRSLVIHTNKENSMDLLCPYCHSLSVYHNVTSPICPHHPLFGCNNVRVAYMGVAPFIVFNPSDMSSPFGADVDTINFIASKLNFAPKFQPQKSFGEYDLETKKATGMVKTVADDKADMGIGGISITYTRWTAVHFSNAYMGTEYAYAGTMPKPTDPFINVVKVFDKYMWAWVAFVVILMSIGFGVFYAIYRHTFDVPYIIVRSMCPADFLLFSISVLAGQTLSYSPFPKMANRSNCRHLGGAFLLGSWLFGALIIASAYKSMILALLVRVDFEEPLSTTQAVLNSGKLFCMAKDTALSAAMESSPNELHRKAYEKAKREGSLYEFVDGKFPPKLRDRMDAEGGSFLSFAIGNVSGYTFTPSKEVILSASQGFIFNKRRPWKRAFDTYLSWLRETGWIKKFIRDHDPKRFSKIIENKRNQHEEQPAAVLTVNHIKGSLYFLLLGHLAALISLLLEIYLGKAKRICMQFRTKFKV